MCKRETPKFAIERMDKIVTLPHTPYVALVYQCAKHRCRIATAFAFDDSYRKWISVSVVA